MMYQPAEQWFKGQDWVPFPFQLNAWKNFSKCTGGIVNAPTGSGKSYALLVPALFEASTITTSGVKVIWLTPIRALAREIELSATRLIEGCKLNLTVGVRTGDTHPAVRQKQKKVMPDVLITTPESLHLLLSSVDHRKVFNRLVCIVADEWHELMGSKRGVQVELAAAYLKTCSPLLKVWGISATIGNLNQALTTLCGTHSGNHTVIVRSEITKKLSVQTLIPETFERLPWSGHIGVQLAHKVCEVIAGHQSTLIFTNTRAQCEIWYKHIIEHQPDLAGLLAMHHSALDRDLRTWVEDALYNGKLRAVVCTSSLDLGVDFRPVDAVVQVGGPKGVARFVQRAGRSGHRPGAESKIWFLPTHALELVEAAALRKAIEGGYVEERHPHVRSFDVLIQFMTTLATGGGFNAHELQTVITGTHAFASVSDDEWSDCLRFITTGGASLQAYTEFSKVCNENGWYTIASPAHARRHRMSVGTIVGDSMVRVKYRRGAALGFVEEYFAAGLNEGDVFWFGGRGLEMLSFRGTDLEVRNTTQRSGRIPAWQGGRLPLSSMLSDLMQSKIDDYLNDRVTDPEMERIRPVFDLQQERSCLPTGTQLLIEHLHTREGFHIFVYPFAGRLVHEAMASLVAWRIGRSLPISYSMAFNDYGFELLSDQEVHISEAMARELFSADQLLHDLQSAINAAEMAKRRFRDIAVIAGLVFRGYPGAPVKDRHLQSSSSLVYDVFAEYDQSNLLLRQAYDEMLHYQLDVPRFMQSLRSVSDRKLVIVHLEKPSPLCFPIMVDRLRERMSTEALADRIARMQRQYDA